MRNHHVSAVTTETLVSLIFWGITAGSVFGGWLSDRLGHRKWLVFVGALFTAIAYAGALYLPGPIWLEAVLLFAAGFFGGPQMLIFAMAKEGQSNRLTGTVVAFVNTIGIAGAMIFQPLVGHLADRSDGDFRLALTVVPLCAALAAVLVLFLPEYRHPDHRPRARQPISPSAQRPPLNTAHDCAPGPRRCRPPPPPPPPCAQRWKAGRCRCCEAA